MALNLIDNLISTVQNTQAMAEAKEEANDGIYAFSANDIDGKQTSLSKYKGKLLFVCNVASK